MLLESPSMFLPLLFDNRLCIEKKLCKASESCFNSAKQTKRPPIDYLIGHLAALTRSHLIGDHPSGSTKEQTTETMDPSPKTKELRGYPLNLSGHYN